MKNQTLISVREVLEFYGDPDTYDANGRLDRECMESGFRPDVMLVDPIVNDRGEKAREVLTALDTDLEHVDGLAEDLKIMNECAPLWPALTPVLQAAQNWLKIQGKGEE